MRISTFFARCLMLCLGLCLSLVAMAQTPVTQFEDGRYYHLNNVAYPDRWATILLAGDTPEAHALPERPNDVAQLWQAVAIGSKWGLKNVATGQYLSTGASASATIRFTDTPEGFTVSVVDAALGTLAFQGRSLGVHASKSQGYSIVGWYNDGPASHWKAIPSTMTPEQIATGKQKYTDILAEQTNASAFTTKLLVFFEDYACTTLKPAYRSLSDEALRSALAAEGLSAKLQEVAVRVKNNQWHTDAMANTYERNFRIASYGAYSDPEQWARPSNKLMVTSFRYSQLTNPTGISVAADQVLYLFVESDVPAGTTLRAELVSGHAATGRQYSLRKGFNAIYAASDAQLFIYYNIDNISMRLDQVPPVKIHVEGGKVNGYFDVKKHTQDDWANMRALMPHGFLAEPVFFVKSETLLFSLVRNSVIQSDDQKKWWFRGENKGLAGWTKLWDNIHQEQRNMLSVERYADRFNCILFVDESKGLYATNYGVYMGGAARDSYTGLYYGNNNYNGGNVWAIAHEIGHHYQQLFTTAGTLECSNNLFANISMWRMGTMVSRGSALQRQFDKFNNNVPWSKRSIEDRFRMYYQLWQYYVELGHKPTFFKELLDKFRETPLVYRNHQTNPSTAKTDFLQFARFCADVAQEDLTEFFEFHGFFSETGTAVLMLYGDGFYDGPGGYGKQYLTITQEEIDETKRYLARYPKKRGSLFFIDDRIKQTPATNPDAPAGTMRFTNSSGVTPGNPSIVGDVGMYTDYAPATAQPATPAVVSLVGRTLSVTGEAAVGYKVYDETGRLIFVANRHTFTLPESIDLTKITVKVGGGDGSEQVVMKDGEVLAPYTPAVPILVATVEGAPEYTYTLRQTAHDTRYIGSTTAPATEANKAQLAFYASATKGHYYIYNVAAGQWLAHTDLNTSPVRVTLVATKGEASLWQVEHEATTSTVDILPAATANTAAAARTAWEWTSDPELTLAARTDADASWRLALTTPPTLLTPSEEVDLRAMLLSTQAASGLLPADAERLATYLNLYATSTGDDKVVFAERIRSEMLRLSTATHNPAPAVGQVYRLKNANPAFSGQTDRVITSSPSGELSWQAYEMDNVYEYWQLQRVGSQYALVNLATGQRIVSATAATSMATTATGELRMVSQKYPGLFLLHFGSEYLTAMGTAASGTLAHAPNTATRPANALTLDGATINGHDYVAPQAAWLLMPVAELEYPTITAEILADIRLLLHSRGAAGAYTLAETETLANLYQAYTTATASEKLPYHHALVQELERLRTDASVARVPAPQAGKVYNIRLAHIGFANKPAPLLHANNAGIRWAVGYDGTQRAAQWLVASKGEQVGLTNLANYNQYVRANAGLAFDLEAKGDFRPIHTAKYPGYYDIKFDNTHLHAGGHKHGAGTSGGVENYGNGGSRETNDLTLADFTINGRDYIAGASVWLFYEVEPTLNPTTDVPLVEQYINSAGFVGGISREAGAMLAQAKTAYEANTTTGAAPLLRTLLTAHVSPRLALNPNQPYRLRSAAPEFVTHHGKRPVFWYDYDVTQLFWGINSVQTPQTRLSEIFYFEPTDTHNRFTLREANHSSAAATFSQVATMAQINASTHPGVMRIVLHGYKDNANYTLAMYYNSNGTKTTGREQSYRSHNNDTYNFLYRNASLGLEKLYHFSGYYLEPVTEVSAEVANQYGSFYYPFAVEMEDLSGVEGVGKNAYRAVRNSAGSLTIEPLGTGSITIPKHTATILSRGSYTMRVLADDATPSWTTPSAPLQGVLAPKTIPADSYVLALVDGSVVFARTEAGMLPANRVYIPATTVSGSPRLLHIDAGLTTAINGATTSDSVVESAVIYDLTGRRVQRPAKGVYIINGQKVLITD